MVFFESAHGKTPRAETHSLPVVGESAVKGAVGPSPYPASSRGTCPAPCGAGKEELRKVSLSK